MFNRRQDIQERIADLAKSLEVAEVPDVISMINAGRRSAEILNAIVTALAQKSPLVPPVPDSRKAASEQDLATLRYQQIRGVSRAIAWSLDLVNSYLEIIDPHQEAATPKSAPTHPWGAAEEEVFRRILSDKSGLLVDKYLQLLTSVMPNSDLRLRAKLLELDRDPKSTTEDSYWPTSPEFARAIVAAAAAGTITLAVAAKALYALEESSANPFGSYTGAQSAARRLATSYSTWDKPPQLAKLRETLAPYCAPTFAPSEPLGYLVLLAVDTLSEEKRHAQHNELIAFVQTHWDELFPHEPAGQEAEPWALYGYLDAHLGHESTDFRNRLSQAAFTGPAEHYREAQMVLVNRPWWPEETINQIRHGKAQPRNRALKLITTHPRPEFVAPLRDIVATASSKTVVEKCATALNACGKPLLRYNSTAAIETAAAKLKAPPAALAWMDWSALPALICAESGQQASAGVAPWLLKSLVAAKSSVPDEELAAAWCCYTSLSRQEFAEAVLDQWIAEDTRLCNVVEAEKLAQADFDRHSSFWRAHFADLNDEEILQNFAAQYLERVYRSQAATSYVTAIASLVDSAEIPRTVQRYVTSWPKRRTQIGRLLEMLAARSDEESLAIIAQCAQVHKDAGVRKTAAVVLQQVAARRECTVAELSLLAIPRFGLDVSGQRNYVVTGKTYRVSLGTGLAVEFTNPQGKKVKSIPCQDARADIRELKKACKKAEPLLRDIFRDALYCQSSWSADAWQAHIAEHPIVRQVATSVIWQSGDPQAPQSAQTFRLLPDGTIIDATDNDLPAPNRHIWVAFSNTVPREQQNLWQENFADYEIPWLLPQFGQEIYSPTPQQMSINDREGHVLDTFAMRSAALKAGFTQYVEDGYVTGWVKPLGPAGTLVIECTPIQVPMEVGESAVISLTLREFDDFGATVPLATCPPAALTLASALYHQLAALGSGYVEGWAELIA